MRYVAHVPDMRLPDYGREFEQRALAVARAIYDPSSTQGPVIFNGREHDAVFVDSRAVVAFEFTQQPYKEKAVKDAQKIRDILLALSRESGNRAKTLHGFVVTEQEPTGDQRTAVSNIAQASRLDIRTISLIALRKSLIDTEKYLALRREAPFGSTAYRVPAAGQKATDRHYVEPSFATDTASHTLDELIGMLETGSRLALVADFGAGKSEALRQMFERLRKRYFRAPTEHKIPLHLNLKDAFGLRSPREVLRRHAEDIGFSDEDSVIAAWRAGDCTLLLDGFDELVPSRWVGGAKDLRQVRWQALEPVRRLVAETPIGCGIVVTGRPQYFSDTKELLGTLALDDGVISRLFDFSQDQVDALLGGRHSIPEWVPLKPLLLYFLLQNDLLGHMDKDSGQPARAWRSMLSFVSAREAERVGSLTPATVKSLIARVATIARSRETGLGPISIKDMKEAFRDACGYEADEEGLQLLLRLPGLARTDDDDSSTESRQFIDVSLADASYGEDLAQYIASPYSRHPLNQGVSWTAAAGSLAAGVAAASLAESGFDAGMAGVSVRKRVDEGLLDSVLLDVVRVADGMGARPAKNVAPFFLEVLVNEIVLPGSDSYIGNSTFKDCIIERVDVRELEGDSAVPNFESCLIGRIDGWSKVPSSLVAHFESSEISTYSAEAQTTSGLMSLSMPQTDRIALVILKKVYSQSGSGRRESALPRGLRLTDRPAVPAVLSSLVSLGYVLRATGQGEDLIVPVKARRQEVATFLSSPHAFSVSALSSGSSST